MGHPRLAHDGRLAEHRRLTDGHPRKLAVTEQHPDT